MAVAPLHPSGISLDTDRLIVISCLTEIVYLCLRSGTKLCSAPLALTNRFGMVRPRGVQREPTTRVGGWVRNQSKPKTPLESVGAKNKPAILLITNALI
jgi:hypothetical protein